MNDGGYVTTAGQPHRDRSVLRLPCACLPLSNHFAQVARRVHHHSSGIMQCNKSTDRSDEAASERSGFAGTARPYSHDTVERHVDKLRLAVDRRCTQALTAVHKSTIRWLLAGHEAVDGGHKVGDSFASKLPGCNSSRCGARQRTWSVEPLTNSFESRLSCNRRSCAIPAQLEVHT